MTDMYLLFQWTEEREAKNHIGIYSTIDKAKAAAQLDADESKLGTLGWDDEMMVGWIEGNQDSWENPYDIEKFEVDLFTSFAFGPGTDNPTITKTNL